MTNTSRLYDLLYDAQAELLNAIEHLNQYVRLSGDSEAEAYIVDQLKVIASRNHGFLASDLNIDDLLERLDERDDDEDDEPGPAISYDEPGPAIRTSDGRILYWSDTLADYVAIPTN